MQINIDDTLKIMLKGVADHTAKEEIIEKLKKLKPKTARLTLSLVLTRQHRIFTWGTPLF